MELEQYFVYLCWFIAERTDELKQISVLNVFYANFVQQTYSILECGISVDWYSNSHSKSSYWIFERALAGFRIISETWLTQVNFHEYHNFPCYLQKHAIRLVYSLINKLWKKFCPYQNSWMKSWYAIHRQQVSQFTSWQCIRIAHVIMGFLIYEMTFMWILSSQVMQNKYSFDTRTDHVQSAFYLSDGERFKAFDAKVSFDGICINGTFKVIY